MDTEKFDAMVKAFVRAALASPDRYQEADGTYTIDFPAELMRGESVRIAADVTLRMSSDGRDFTLIIGGTP